MPPSWLPAEETGAEERLREGHDFLTQEELRALGGAQDWRWMRPSTAAALAAQVTEELRWLEWTDELPGGLPWDEQPAWRVRLWAHALEARERAEALAAGMR